MTRNIIERVQSVAHRATRRLHAESVTLRTAAGAETVITDAMVSEVPPAVSRGEGPIDYECILRLKGSDRQTAIDAHTAVVRSHTWNIISVGDVYADSFRVELSRRDTDHSNIFDANEDMADWYDT